MSSRWNFHQQGNLRPLVQHRYPESRENYRDNMSISSSIPNSIIMEPVPKLIDCALTRTVLGQAFAVFQAFSFAKLRISRLLSQKLKFWESLNAHSIFFLKQFPLFFR
jgi:hypothetical protein